MTVRVAEREVLFFFFFCGSFRPTALYCKAEFSGKKKVIHTVQVRTDCMMKELESKCSPKVQEKCA